MMRMGFTVWATACKCHAAFPKKSRRSTTVSWMVATLDSFEKCTVYSSFSPCRRGSGEADAALAAGGLTLRRDFLCAACVRSPQNHVMHATNAAAPATARPVLARKNMVIIGKRIAKEQLPLRNSLLESVSGGAQAA